MDDIYDIRGLVSAMGGALGVVDKIHKATGELLTKKAVEKWTERASIPGRSLLLCELTFRRLKLDHSVTDFIKTH